MSALLAQKIEAYIRRYYLNRVIRGVLYVLSILVASFTLVSVLSFFSQWNSNVRFVLFVSLIGLYTGVIIWYFIIPLAKLYKLGKVMGHEEAAKAIGTHFPEVKDKLLNTLELQRQYNENPTKAILAASIEQKAQQMSSVSFTSAIDFSENKKYLKYAIPPLIILTIILIGAPNIVKQGTEKIVLYDREFVPEAPFDFHLENKTLKVVKGEDITINVSLTGSLLPNKLYIDIDGNTYAMQKADATSYSYTIQQAQSDVSFRFYSEPYYSKSFALDVVPRATLNGLQIELDFPEYINRPSEREQNTGDLFVPEGTRATWSIHSKSTSDILFSIGDTTLEVKRVGETLFQAAHTLSSSATYSIIPRNEENPTPDTSSFSIQVIKDAYPAINVQTHKDSTNPYQYYFTGKISDDYGLTSLTFFYEVKRKGSIVNKGSVPVGYNTKGLASRFYHGWNTQTLEVQPSDVISYYFTVGDNDGIHGSKYSSSTKAFVYVPSKEALKKEEERANEDIKKELADLKKEYQDIQKELDALDRKFLENKSFDWEQRQQMKNVVKKHQSLQERIEELLQKQQQKNEQSKQFETASEELLEKQKELEELMEKVLDPETKKLLEELEKMMDELNKNQAQEKLDQLRKNSEDLEKEMDRSLELFKQLEFEKSLEETMDRIAELKKEQEDILEKTDDKNTSPEELKKEQEAAQKELENVKKDLESLQEKNEELENSHTLPDTKKEESKASDGMQESKESLEKGKKGKSKTGQEKAKEALEELEEKLAGLEKEMKENQKFEDMQAMRQLLENLIQLSFDQEDVIEQGKELKGNDPRFVKTAERQKELRENAQIIEDSLFALSKRNVQISSIVNKEISTINQRMDKSVAFLADRKLNEALRDQQYAMQSVNNLAVMIDEILQNAQKQMSSQMFGEGSCSKPGSSGSPSSGSMKDIQKQLSEQLKKMKEALEKGKQDGGKGEGGQKPGESSGQGGEGGQKPGSQGMSEDLAKMAREQGMLREQLRKLSEQLGGGQGGAEQAKILEELQQLMEQNEKDIVNRNITRETIARQEKIMTRMLESEKAERERELDNKRESREGVTKNEPIPDVLKEYLEKKEQQTELIETVPPGLNPFYKRKVNEYFNN